MGYSVILLNCTPKSHYAASILHQSTGFSSRDLSGHSVLLLSVLTRHGPDSCDALSPATQALWFAKVRPDLRILDRTQFENEYAALHDTSFLGLFYRDVVNQKALSVRSNDSVWRSVPTDFVLTISLRNGSTIKSFDQSVHRRVVLEGELWSTARADVMWRVSVEGRISGPGSSESAFMRGAIMEVFRSLPSYAPSAGETDW